MNPAGLDSLELENIGQVFYNLSFDELIEHELRNGECKMTSSGATTVDTGIFTGRSPKDKYFVDREPSNKYIAWGNVNKKVSPEIFAELLVVAQEQLSNKDLYVTDVFCGSSAASKRLGLSCLNLGNIASITNGILNIICANNIEIYPNLNPNEINKIIKAIPVTISGFKTGMLFTFKITFLNFFFILKIPIAVNTPIVVAIIVDNTAIDIVFTNALFN